MTLELFTGSPDDTLASRMRACIQAEALEGLVKDAKRHVRVALEDAVDQQSEVTGTSFTAKVDGWSAQFTDPQPKPSVTDHEAFAGWWVGEGLEHRTVERVEVVDHPRAVSLMLALDGEDPGDVYELADCFMVVTEHVLPDKPLDLLTAPRFKATDDGLVDTDTGEMVPGVECFRSARQLRLVPKDKRVRLEAKREVGVRLGVRPELLDGGGS